MSKQSTIITGRQPVLEALKSGRQMERIYLLKNGTGEIINEIRKLAVQNHVPVNLVPVEKLHSLTRGNHQGVVAISSLIQYMDLQQIIDHTVGSGETPLFLMLDGITDVRNIGAMTRTALVCGVQALIIPDKGVGALNEEAMKSSAGALEKMNVCRVDSLLKAVDTLHLNGIQVFSSEMKSGKKVFEIDFKGPCCIIMGSEDKGIQRYLTKASDDQFTIPMKPGFDSLNVSVAAGIILFEALKQRSF